MNVMLKVFWNQLLPVQQQQDNDLLLNVPLGAMIPFHLAGGSGNIIAVNGHTGPVVTLDYQDVLAESALDAQLRHAEVLEQLNTRLTSTELMQSLGAYPLLSTMQQADAVVLASAQIGIDQQVSQLRTELADTLDNKADLVNGVLPTSQLPALAFSQFLGEVSSQADMLALQGQSGDWCIRSDLGMTYIIIALNNTGQLADWIALPQANGAVSTVNGQTGVVVLGYADVGAEQAGAVALLQGNMQSQLNNKAEAVAVLQALNLKTDKATRVLAGSGLSGGDLSADCALALADSGVDMGTYCKVSVNSKGVVTAGLTLDSSDIPVLDWSKITTGKPFTLGGYGITDAVNSNDVSSTATASKLLKLDMNSKLPADITGSAATAAQLTVARNIALSGAVTGSSSFDGSASININATLSDSGVAAGTFSKLTVNSNGIVTAGTNLQAIDIPALDWTKITTGKPATLSGYGITDAQALDATLTALAGLSTSADSLIYATGSDAFTTTPLTSAGRALLDDADVVAQRATLGLGTAAVVNYGTASGNAMLVGAFGLGSANADLMTSAGSGGFDTAAGKSQFLRYSTTTENRPGIIGSAGTGIHIARASDGSNDTQLAFDSTGKIAGRAKPSGTWSGWFSVYTSHNPVAYNTTTASAANVVVSSSGELQRSTSSMKYKTDVEPMWSSIAQALVDQAEPFFYRSLCSADNPQHSWYGLSAEQIASIDPRFVLWKTHDYVTLGAGESQRTEFTELDSPEIEGVYYERLVVPLLLVVKQLKQQVAALEQRLDQLQL